MLMLVRHLLSIAALPFIMAVVIPTWIARRDHITPRIGPTLPLMLVQIGGIVILVIGLILFLSKGHLWWALTFFAINAVYIPLFEEPQLEGRFGESYKEYRRHVPRMLPRLRPWQPEV